MKIIPAIDIIDGKCVRLTKGDFNTIKVYNENPLEVAKEFEDNGIQYLHVVDLDGANSKRIVNYKVLEQLASRTMLKIDFGGGIKSDEDLKIAFDSGADQITAGSIAVKDRKMFLRWLDIYGSDRILLGADCNNRKIATNGWNKQSDWDVVDFIQKYEAEGIENVICTDIAKDGMLRGTSNELYKEIMEKSNVKLVASGGVSNINCFHKLKELGCDGAILGKAFYEGRITLRELKPFLN